jgi:hypothetical protein
MGLDIEFVPSAFRHGVSKEDILKAYETMIAQFQP